MSLEPESRSPFGRPLTLVDRSRTADGVDAELGHFRGDVFAFVEEVDPVTGAVVKARTGRLQPRNWHYVESDDPLFVDLPDLKDKRFGLSLVAEDQHAFDGFTLDPEPDAANPFGNDWGFDQKSTRIIDYDDPKGRAALLAQLVKVVDDLRGEYVPAIPIGPEVMGAGTFLGTGPDPDAASGSALASSPDFGPSNTAGVAAAGYTWDGQRTGLLSTLLHPINPDDILGAGREGTECGIQGLRRIAHFEWGPKHGSLHLDKTDLVAEPGGHGPIFPASLRHWPAVANNPGLHETGQWAPWYRATFFVPEEGNPGGPIVEPPMPPRSELEPPDGVPSGSATGTPVILAMPGSANGMSPAVDNVLDPSLYGQMVFAVGQGPDGDRTVVMVAQGDEAGADWGMTLPTETWVGVDVEDEPQIKFGHGGPTIGARADGSLAIDGGMVIGDEVTGLTVTPTGLGFFGAKPVPQTFVAELDERGMALIPSARYSLSNESRFRRLVVGKLNEMTRALQDYGLLGAVPGGVEVGEEFSVTSERRR